MHAQNFARAISMIEKDRNGEAYRVTLHMCSGRNLYGAITAMDGVFVWLIPDELTATSILVDVNYIESIAPRF